MKVIALALAFIALSLASANATHRYHHHWRHHSSMGARYNPNGAAGGPTTLSGTGSSHVSLVGISTRLSCNLYKL